MRLKNFCESKIFDNFARNHDFPHDTNYIFEGYFGHNGVPPNRVTVVGESIKSNADILSYWSQINISLALALERYILIAKATNAGSLLSKSRRRKIYAFTIFWISIPSLLYIILRVDHLKRYTVVGVNL